MRTRVIIGIFFTVVILALLIGGLWWLGHQKTVAQKQTEDQILQEALAKEKSIQKLVINKVSSGDDFANFTLADWGTPFTLKDIKIYNTVSPKKASVEEATDYSINLAQILSPLNLSANQPLRTLLEVYNNSNSTAIIQLKETASAHQKALGAMLNLRVPQDAAVVHLQLVNALREMSNALKAMSEVGEEPIKAGQAGQDYSNFFNHLISAMALANTYFTDHQVKFNNLNTIKVELPQ